LFTTSPTAIQYFNSQGFDQFIEITFYEELHEAVKVSFETADLTRVECIWDPNLFMPCQHEDDLSIRTLVPTKDQRKLTLAHVRQNGNSMRIISGNKAIQFQLTKNIARRS
jgi:hypothetical protein